MKDAEALLREAAAQHAAEEVLCRGSSVRAGLGLSKGGSEGFGLAARALKAATPSLCGGRWWCHELFLKLLGSGAQWGGGARV